MTLKIGFGWILFDGFERQIYVLCLTNLPSGGGFAASKNHKYG
jgi:hypothetical protein